MGAVLQPLSEEPHEKLQTSQAVVSQGSGQSVDLQMAEEWLVDEFQSSTGGSKALSLIMDQSWSSLCESRSGVR